MTGQLSAAEVAAVFGTSRQLVSYWANQGRDAADHGRVFLAATREGKRIWAAPEDVAVFAVETGLEPDWTALTLERQRVLQLGLFAPGAPPVTIESLAEFDQRISEAEAARQLGFTQAGLRERRRRGTLPDVLTKTLEASPSASGGVTYSQRAVWAHKWAGE